MEEKEKIVLKDGTTYQIENGASENSVQVILQTLDEVPDVFRRFTEDNLESFRIQNSEGLTFTTRENKYMVDAVVEEKESNVFVTFRLADVNMTEKRISALESRLEAHNEEIKELKESVSGASLSSRRLL